MPYTFIGRDSSIGEATVFNPHSYCAVGANVGKNCIIGPGARVSNTVADNTKRMKR